ncbi:hypothetical protein JYU34_007848 [Plutella xylostella]|uniref:Uncharacterized protein n=1 Tax=Plutella xylostella TaxID=51655 RepID=A0ABQ7QRF0_PLUXY|nr:hypothetical protein JYU34_007848 [Plutella xylostella]
MWVILNVNGGTCAVAGSTAGTCDLQDSVPHKLPFSQEAAGSGRPRPRPAPAAPDARDAFYHAVTAHTHIDARCH